MVIAILFVTACVSIYYYHSVYYGHNYKISKTFNTANFVQGYYVPRTTNATNTTKCKSEVTNFDNKTLKETGKHNNYS